MKNLEGEKFSKIQIGEFFYYQDTLYARMSYSPIGANSIHLEKDHNYTISLFADDIVYPVNVEINILN